MAGQHVGVTITVEGRDHVGERVTQTILVRADLLDPPSSKRNDAAQVLTTQRVSELFAQLYAAACPPITTGAE